MNADNDKTLIEGQEQRLAEFLASFDEFLKTADASKLSDSAAAELSPAALSEVGRAQDCLRLLEAVWPRRPAAPPTLVRRVGQDSASPGGPAPIQTQLGRFLVQCELGRGGFGTVYLAHDPQLGRAIALKIPHSNVLGDKELRGRFHQEARAAGVLDHPHIVQVYEAGEADGLAYIALAYCPGINLADWLHQRSEPVPLADAAQLVATLAAAVQHAHDRGIVHRDLKPANVLLVSSSAASDHTRNGGAGKAAATPQHGPRDASAVHDTARLPTDSLPTTHRTTTTQPLSAYQPKITDFGLAKHLDAAATLTLSGTILGTPCYMAPEQAGANPNQAGQAADIYSLGAILYELLTAQPPFHGDTPLETLHQVRFDEPVSPSRLRRSVPGDLTTICLKCLEKEPSKRFSSATALAEDLRRFLEGRPIHARPISRLGRTIRWCRRKPVVAALLTTLFFAVVGGFSGISWQWQRAEDALDQANNTSAYLKIERDRVVGEWQRAERNLNRARNLVDRLTNLANELSGKPGLDPTSRKLLEEALVFHQEVLEEKSDDPSVRLQAARGYGLVGDIRHTLREWDKAVEARRQAIALLDALQRDFPETASYRVALAASHRSLAHVLRDSKKPQEARIAYDAAIALEKTLLDEEPQDGKRLVALANTLLNSVFILPAAELAVKDQRILQAVSYLREANKITPASRHFRLELALGLSNAGWMQMRLKDHAAAEDLFREVLQIRSQLHEEKMVDRDQERYLAGAYRQMAQLLTQTKRLEEAERHYRQSAGLLRGLIADFPTRPIHRIEIAGTLVDFGELLVKIKNDDHLEPCLTEALDQYEKLAADYPAEPEHLRGRARAAFLLGEHYKRHNNLPAALQAFDRMLAANESLIEQFHSQVDRNNRGWDLSLLAGLNERAGNLVEAERRWRQSCDDYRRLAEEYPDNPEYARKLASRGDGLTRLLRKAGKSAEAKQANRSALADWQKLVSRFNLAGDRNGLINCLLLVAGDYKSESNYAQVAKHYREAVLVMPESSRVHNELAWFLATCPEPALQAPAEARQSAERAVKLSPKNGNYRNTLGVACYRAKDYAAALRVLDEAIDLRGEGTAWDWFFQAMARRHLHDKEGARRDFDKALAWTQKNAPNDAELRRFQAEAQLLLGISDRAKEAEKK